MGSCSTNCANHFLNDTEKSHEDIDERLYYHNSDSKHIVSKIIKNEKEMINKFESFLDTFSLVDSKSHTLNLAKFTNDELYLNNQRFDSIVKQLKKRNEIFVDEMFNPEYQYQLKFKTNETYADSEIMSLNEYQISLLKASKVDKITDIFFLKNPHDIINSFQNENFELSSYSSSTQIKFNYLGNANLFNCILYLTIKNKYYLKNILYQFDYATKTFCIKLFHNKKQKLIVLDESVLINESYSPLFINANEKTFWLILIEKALSKLTSSYDIVVNGFASDLFPYLSYVPIMREPHDGNNIKETMNNLWTKMKNCLNKKNIIFVENKKKSRFSFFIAGAFVVNKTKYVEMILPELNAAYKSDVMSIKKEIEINLNDIKEDKFFPESKINSDKILFMPFEYYFNFFSDTFFIFYSQNYFHTVKEISINEKENINDKIDFNFTTEPTQPKTSIIKLKSLQTNHLFLSLSFSSPFSFPFRLIISKLTTTNESLNDEYIFEFVSSVFINDSVDFTIKNNIELDIDSGIYYIFIKSLNNSPSKVTISIYSSTYIEIMDSLPKQKILYKNVDMHIMNNLSAIYKSLFMSYLSKNGDEQVVDSERDLIYKYSISNDGFGYSVIGVKNNSNDVIIYVSIEYKVKGMTLLNISDNPHSDNDMIICAPKKENLFVFEWTDNVNDISIDIKPKFYIKKYFLGDLTMNFFEDNRLMIHKHLMSDECDDVYYSIIEGAFGIYFIVENEGNCVYEIEGKISLEVEDEKLSSEICLRQVNPFTKEHAFLFCDGLYYLNYMNNMVKIELKCKKI